MSRIFSLKPFLGVCWLLLFLVFSGPANAAKWYADNGDGTVSDPTTGLTWMRCAMGQTWDASAATCTGTVSTYTWDTANAVTGTVNFAGQSDWRLPNIRELQTLVNRIRYNPAIDTTAFPNVPSSYPSSLFWSGSPNVGVSYYAWGVYFDDGNAGSVNRSDSGAVRLVRSGQSFGPLNPARPNADYVDQVNGVVLHTPTRLIWQRCAVGQSYTGSTCSGTPSTYTWNSVIYLTSAFAGQTDWRLPTADELISLVDYEKWNPALNTTLFPNTSSSIFWSGSYTQHSVSSGVGVWGVNFNNGSAYGVRTDRFGYAAVRWVRGGQCFGSLALTLSATGAGQIDNPSGLGFSCNGNPSWHYAGDVITLRANPASRLLAWGGACASAGSAPTCSVTMDAAKSVSATFWPLTGLPTAMRFAAQNPGITSISQSVTLENTGAQAYTLGSISASGDFAATHTCGTSLAVGASCTVSVNFTPTALGARTGTLSVVSNAPGGPYTVPLSGTGQGATAVASPSSLSFYQNVTGVAGSAKTVTLSNTGSVTLNIASITTSGDFARSATTCTPTLARGNSCRIDVTFNPTAVGERTGTLTITHDAAAGNPTTVALSGTGVAVPIVTLNPNVLNFASRPLGSTSPAQTLTLRNSGLGVLTLSNAITASGDFAQSNNCGTSLGAGAACSIDVTFTPTVSGGRSGSISFSSNAAGSPHSVVLSGAKTLQSINVANRPDIAVGGTGVVNAVASSGLAVAFSVAGSSAAVCALSGASATAVTVTGLASGLCTVMVNQGGNTTWAPALTAQVSFSVKQAQTISFGGAPTVSVGGTGTVSATTPSGLALAFSVASSSTGVCSLSNASATQVTVNGLLAGLCTVAADQAGDANWLPAPSVLQSFSIAAVAPAAPGQPVAASAPGGLRLSFAPPAFNGGAPIVSYTATCSAAGQAAKSASAASSPILVSGLKAGVIYSCSVTAFNGSLSSVASAVAEGVPNALDLTPILMLLLD